MIDSAYLDPVALELGPLRIQWYAIFIVLAILVAEWMLKREGQRKGLDPDKLFDIMFWSILLGFVGARLYYVVFQWDYYRAHLGQIIAIWNGGIAIYGGVLAGIVTIYVMCRRLEVSFPTTLDVAAPALLMAQAIGRWGNFMNQEAHGGPVSRDFLQGLGLPHFIIEQMQIQGTYYHPTFLYESLWNLLGVGVILALRRKDQLLKQGDLAALYAIWYGTGRFFIEGMRTDSLMLGSLRVSQWVSLAFALLGTAFMAYQHMIDREGPYYTEDRKERVTESR